MQNCHDLLFDTNGIEITDKISISHITEAINILGSMRYPDESANNILDFVNDPNARNLVSLATKVKTSFMTTCNSHFLCTYSK